MLNASSRIASVVIAHKNNGRVDCVYRGAETKDKMGRVRQLGKLVPPDTSRLLLMRCYLEQSECAQALETYCRCRKMLSIVMGSADRAISRVLDKMNAVIKLKIGELLVGVSPQTSSDTVLREARRIVESKLKANKQR